MQVASPLYAYDEISWLRSQTIIMFAVYGSQKVNKKNIAVKDGCYKLNLHSFLGKSVSKKTNKQTYYHATFT